MIARTAGGVVGPAVIVASWALLGARADGYSPITDPISRLAASGAPTQAAMTAGLLTYAVAVGSSSRALGEDLGVAVGTAAAVNALATAGIAATPLDSVVGGAPHAIAAGVTYASLAAIPTLAARRLVRDGSVRAAATSRRVGLVTAVLLAASAVGTGPTGLLQRMGLTTGHAWLAASSIALARRRGRSRG